MKKRLKVFVSMFVTGIVITIAAFFFISSSESSKGLAGGYSEAVPVFEKEWNGNLRLLQETAQALDIKVKNPESVEGFLNALSGVNSLKLAEIEYLDLSNSQLIEVPLVLRYYTGLKELDLSRNQLIYLPDFLLEKQDLELHCEFNLLPQDSSNMEQATLLVPELSEEAFRRFTFEQKFDPDTITSLANESLQVTSPSGKGGNRIAPLYDGHMIAFDFHSFMDEMGNPYTDYMNANTHLIVKSGELVANLYVTDKIGLYTGATMPVRIQLVAPDLAPIAPDRWEENEPFINGVLDTYEITNIEEVSPALLLSQSTFEIHHPDFIAFPEAITAFQNLETLDLSNSMVRSVEHLEKLPNLKTLILSSNGLETLPTGIESLTQLETLILDNNHLTGEALRNLFSLSSLKALNISENQITVLPEEIRNLSALETLNISHNQVAQFPEIAVEMGMLKDLDMSNNQITKIPDEVEAFVTQQSAWKFERNLLSKQHENQRSIDTGSVTALRIPVKGIYEEEKVIAEVQKSLKLSDGEKISSTLSLELRTFEDDDILYSGFLSEDGFVIKGGPLTVRVLVNEQTNEFIPVMLDFMVEEAVLSSNHLLEEIETTAQSKISEKIEQPQEESILETLSEPEILSSEVFEKLAKSSKNLEITLQAAGNLQSYTWGFSGSQTKYYVPVDLEIREGSPYQGQMEALLPKEQGQIFSSKLVEKLPGNTVLEIAFSEAFEENKNYALYQYDTDQNKLRYAGGVQVQQNIATVVLDETGDYIILPIGGTINSAELSFSPQLERHLEFLAYALLASVVLLMICAMYVSFQSNETSFYMPEDRAFADVVHGLFIDSEEDEQGVKEAEVKQEKKVAREAQKQLQEEVWLKNEMYKLPVYTSSSQTAKNPMIAGVVWERTLQEACSKQIGLSQKDIVEKMREHFLKKE